MAQGFIRQSDAAAQIQMCQAGAVRGDSSQALVLQGKTIGHVQVVDGDLLAVKRGQLQGGLLGKADTCDLGAAWRKRKQRLSAQKQLVSDKEIVFV